MQPYSSINASNSFVTSKYIPLRKVSTWKINALAWFLYMQKKKEDSIEDKKEGRHFLEPEKVYATHEFAIVA